MADSASLTRLAPELLTLIVEYSSISALKALRLAWPDLRTIIDPRLFSSIVFPRFNSDRRLFTALCESDTLRHHVKELRYSVTIVNTVDNFESFKNLLLTWQPSLGEMEQQQLWEEHQRATTYQGEENTLVAVSNMLGHGLSRLPNISIISIVQDSKHAGWFLRFPYLRCAYEDWYVASFSFALWWNYDVLVDNAWDLSDLRIISMALSKTDHRIHTFSSFSRTETGEPSWHDTPTCQLSEHSLGGMLQDAMGTHSVSHPLTSFALSLESTADMTGGYFLAAHLQAQAHTLKECSLDFRTRYNYNMWNNEPITEYRDDLQMVFLPTVYYSDGSDDSDGSDGSDGSETARFFELAQSVHLPSLRSLSLSNLSTSGATLCHILKTHKLETLNLVNIYHYSTEDKAAEAEEWDMVLDSIRHCRLKSTTLKNISGFIRDTTGITHTTLDVVQDAMNGREYSDDFVAKSDPRVLKILTSILPNGMENMPTTIRDEQLDEICTQLQPMLQISEIIVRERTAKDQAQLQPLIMDYVNGVTQKNPLRGLKLYALQDWPEDPLMRPGILDEFLMNS